MDLEEKIHFLERHIEQQDREMYKLSVALDQLTRQVDTLQKKLGQLPSAPSLPDNEKPPHY